jgi:large subunit ribosomal protein L25
MRKDITLVAEIRETRGKNNARRLRVAKLSPAVLYGAGKDPVAVSVSPKEVGKILHSSTGYNTIFNLDVKGDVTPVMIADWQTDPLKGQILHIDLKRIDLTKKVNVMVPILTTGDPVGVKLQGGHYELVNREVEIEVLPDDIPEHFTLDAQPLKLNESLRAKDIPMTGSMRLLSDPELVLSHVVSLKADEAVDAEKAAEPEVMKKGKKEDPAAKAPAAKGAAAKAAPAKAAKAAPAAKKK